MYQLARTPHVSHLYVSLYNLSLTYTLSQSMLFDWSISISICDEIESRAVDSPLFELGGNFECAEKSEKVVEEASSRVREYSRRESGKDAC